MAATDPKTTTTKTADPEPVGSAPPFTSSGAATSSDSTSLPLSGRAASAGESSDPVVQRLLAEKAGHQMNRDLIDPPVVDKSGLDVVDEAIANVDDKLADLGFPQESQADRKARLEKDAAEADKKAKADAKRRDDRAAAREKARTADASA